MISDERLDELEALANAATPEPWRMNNDKDCDVDVVGPNHTAEDEGDDRDCVFYQWVGSLCERHDAAFIAASRTAIPELIAEVRRLKAAASRVYGPIPNDEGE